MKIRLRKVIGTSVISACWALMLLLSGCIKDDYANCPMAVNLRFVYTLNMDNAERFAEQVTHTDLFIYDESGILYGTQRVETSSMTPAAPEGMATSLRLLPGKYTIVAWSNLNATDYDVLTQSNLAHMQVQLKQTATVTKQQSSLFHGMTSIEVKERYSVNSVVEMTKDVNDIHIILYSDSGDSDFSQYTVEITGSNGLYNYDNTQAASSLLHYMPLSGYQAVNCTTPEGKDAKGIQTDHRVMRLFNGDDMRIVIRWNDTIIYDESLTDAVLQVPHTLYSDNEYLDREDDYILKYKIITHSLTLISINDWVVKNQNGGL